MTISGIFNNDADGAGKYTAKKVNSNVLLLKHYDDRKFEYCIDFAMQTVSILIGGCTSDRICLFSEIDRGVLEFCRQTLIDLGGDPRPLPPPPGFISKHKLSLDNG